MQKLAKEYFYSITKKKYFEKPWNWEIVLFNKVCILPTTAD